MSSDPSLEGRLGRYIAHRLPEASEVRATELDRIFGGASRETYRFVLGYRTPAGEEVSRRLILRRDPPGSLIETERAVEFAAYRAFYGTSVPVPEPLWLEEDASWLDHPFFIMAEMSGFEASPQAIVAPPYAQHALKFAERKWQILGDIAKADPVALGLVSVMAEVSPESCWDRELSYWENEINQHELSPQPVIRAAIRWLRRNPPPRAQKISVVHADYRTGNFLYDREGEIRGILDWEMVHLGDPLEDLAWGLNPIWRFAGDERAGGLAPREEAIRIWQKSSGLRAEADALRWWELFSSVKGQAIWISSAREFTLGKNQDLILALASWLMGNSQDRAALAELGHLS
jgi:aminoglycoside phosphotransferase (APT) family kinase protein